MRDFQRTYTQALYYIFILMCSALHREASIYYSVQMKSEIVL